MVDSGAEAPDVMKIDVEGAEANILKGASNLLERRECRVFYVEVHPNRLENFSSSPEEVRSLLRDAGYSIEDMEEPVGNYTIKATI